MKTRRRTEEMQALLTISSASSRDEYKGGVRAHNPPVRKMAETPILRRVDICKFQIRKMGTVSIAISENMLKSAEA